MSIQVVVIPEAATAPVLVENVLPPVAPIVVTYTRGPEDEGSRVISIDGPVPSGTTSPLAGAALTGSAVVAAAISGHRVVSPSGSGSVAYADASDMSFARAPLWITTTAAAAGGSVSYTMAGTIVEPSWSWTPRAPLYLASSGVLTQTVPNVADGLAFLVQVAVAITSTSIYVDRQPSVALI